MISTNISASILQGRTQPRRYRGKNKRTKAVFGFEFSNAVHEYVNYYTKDGVVKASKFNPLIDMCLDIGILQHDQPATYITLFPSSAFTDTDIDILKNPTGGNALFMNTRARKPIKIRDFAVCEPTITYSDMVAMMLIGKKLRGFLTEHKQAIIQRLQSHHAIGNLPGLTD